MTAVNDYPAWAQDLPKHLIVDTVDGRPVIRYVHIDGLFWDSGCGYCNMRKSVVEIFPNHEAGPGCESGGQTHCTCDACF